MKCVLTKSATLFQVKCVRRVSGTGEKERTRKDMRRGALTKWCVVRKCGVQVLCIPSFITTLSICRNFLMVRKCLLMGIMCGTIHRAVNGCLGSTLLIQDFCYHMEVIFTLFIYSCLLLYASRREGAVLQLRYMHTWVVSRFNNGTLV